MAGNLHGNVQEQGLGRGAHETADIVLDLLNEAIPRVEQLEKFPYMFEDEHLEMHREKAEEARHSLQ